LSEATTLPLRYSPRPIEAYTVPQLKAGPAFAEFLRNDVEAWNLAFLSHPYELRAEHPDPQFTILVRRTVNTLLSTGSVDVLGKMPAQNTVRSLLRLPPGQFITAILSRRAADGRALIEHLPIYQAYGEPWLDQITARARHCLDAPAV
jgi:hypothetical protein